MLECPRHLDTLCSGTPSMRMKRTSSVTGELSSLAFGAATYGGIQIKLAGHIGKVQIPLQVSCGFGQASAVATMLTSTLRAALQRRL